jgi:nitrite reductase/ring-hydroxylating ferredoxin subunit
MEDPENRTNPAHRRLCSLDDIPDGGALQIDPGEPTHYVLLRRGHEVWAYLNRCPHFSIPLDFEPGVFCTYDASLLMCAHHSAMFRFEDGHCVDGPCAGAALTAVMIEVSGQEVYRRP